MDLTFLATYAVPVIVGICLCIGFIIKQSLSFIKNKYIPLIMAVFGLLLNIWLNSFSFTPEIVLGGLFSGLASTGFHELFRNLIEKGVGKWQNWFALIQDMAEVTPELVAAQHKKNILH